MKHRYLGPLAAATVVTGVLVAPSSADADPGQVVRASGPTFVYQAALSDVATRVQAVSVPSGDAIKTIVTLDVAGMPAQTIGQTFGAHVHVNACGADPLAAGGHYANPDVSPSAPLEEREIWLDFTVDETGAGHAKATRPYHIVEGDANSVVIHAMETDPVTGLAGGRLACTTVAFGAPSDA
jgi:superoxide dismutase, Cu-Zn family